MGVENGVQTRIGRRIETYAGFPRLGFLPGDGPQFLKGLLWPLVTRDHYRRMFGAVTPARGNAGGDGSDSKADGGDEDETLAEAEPLAPRSMAEQQRQAERARDLELHAKLRCQVYAKLIPVMERNHPRLTSDAKEYLLELVKEFEGDGVRVILFTPPFLEHYSACFDARAQRQMRDAAKWITRRTRARYLDFSTDPAFVQAVAWFRDSDHLNGPGRTEFTRRFVAATAKPPRR